MKVIKRTGFKKDGDSNLISLPLENPTDHEASREMIRHHLEAVANLLTDAPGVIKVTYAVGDRTTVYNLDCPQEYLGQIIGSGGKTIMSLRNIFTAVSARIGFRCVLELPYYQNNVVNK